MPTDNKEWTMTFKGKPFLSYISDGLDEEPIEEDIYYRLESDSEALYKHIDKLIARINELKHEVSYLKGMCEAQDRFWRIWNGEKSE